MSHSKHVHFWKAVCALNVLIFFLNADFGLSNEEYIQGENGMIHCSTQCGSPAYAAPELLGNKCQKEHGPEVDIWSM